MHGTLVGSSGRLGSARLLSLSLWPQVSVLDLMFIHVRYFYMIAHGFEKPRLLLKNRPGSSSPQLFHVLCWSEQSQGSPRSEGRWQTPHLWMGGVSKNVWPSLIHHKYSLLQKLRCSNPRFTQRKHSKWSVPKLEGQSTKELGLEPA